MKILIISDWFPPAYKAGGPIRSVANMVDRLKLNHDIYVYTSDRDLNATSPHESIEADKWILREGIHVYYYSPGTMTYKQVKRIIKEVNPDRIYLNSMFSNMILPIMAAGRSGKIILAPRGMLRVSALSIKPLKKYFYLSFLRMMNIDQHITFHSTGKDETKDIRRIFPHAARIVEAPNLPVAVNTQLQPLTKNKHALKVVFVGRMHPIKNLHLLLQCLKNITTSIEVNIIATTEDQLYYQQCKQLIDENAHVHQIYLHLDLPHQLIKPILESSHLFVLPTEGENFGHAIFEALAVGCPFLISDQTPWRSLEEKMAGFDLALDNNAFTTHIQQFIEMDDTQWQQYRHGAWELAKQYEASISTSSGYDVLFVGNQ